MGTNELLALIVLSILIGGYIVLIPLYLVKRAELETLWRCHRKVCDERNEAHIKIEKLTLGSGQTEH
jgi:hypothetical protein